MNGLQDIIIYGMCVFLGLASSGFAQTMESMTARKDRCLRKLERVERSIDKTITGIDRIKRLRQVSPESETPRIDAFVEKTQNKIEYFNNRIERTRNQLEKIETDLQNSGSGSQCPECIVSDVKLFCRHIESLHTEHADLASAINEFERSLRKSSSVSDLIKRTDQVLQGADSSAGQFSAACALQEKARAAIAASRLDDAMQYALEAGDSALALQSALSGGCGLNAEIAKAGQRIEEARRSVGGGGSGKKAAAVLEKAIAHFEKAKSLCAKGKTSGARTELAIAEKFALTAIQCAASKD